MDSYNVCKNKKIELSIQQTYEKNKNDQVQLSIM